ncbi:hypothetical protein F7725_014764 [Dissostichus mawsoni]|uniref:Uncharacterized protein n=1 Tax=Dissostichus mawsoni TaxID=36200 RepID=A0A7J5YXC2_DISMA|nr:hypothetical protein F7725_014764 [Dissostichus mawsoni]
MQVEVWLGGVDGALDRMDQEQGPLLALNLVEGGHRGAVGVHQQLGQIRLQQSLSQLVDGDLADFPHRHDDVVVPLQSLANFNTHQRVQAQVSQRGIRVQAAHIPHT